MIKVSDSVLINRSPEDISGFVADFENAPKWQGGVVEATTSMRVSSGKAAASRSVSA
jgi:hypothetical protein